MKKLLLAGVAVAGLMAAGAANAADLPSRGAPMAPSFAPVAAVPVFTWTGLYFGAQVGYSWNDNSNHHSLSGVYYRDAAGNLVPYSTGFSRSDSDGFLAGVHAGYNLQFGNFVVGIEGDVEGVFGDDDDDDVFGGVIVRDINGNPVTYAFGPNQLDWQASIRARAGIAFDRLLVYGTGGFAFGGVSGGYYSGLFDNNDDTITGWTLGAGLEYALTNNVTTRVEYRYTTFDRDGDVFNNVNMGGNDFDFHTIRAGISVKF
jgi:outer membrane immunogenic protein